MSPAVIERADRQRIRVAIYQPRMCPGGAQRITLTLLKHLDRERFEPTLVVRMAEGDWLERVPEDVQVHFLNSKVRSGWYHLGLLLREIRPDVTISMSTMGNLTVCLGHLFARIDSPLVVAEHNTLSRAWGSSSWKLLCVSGLKNIFYRRARRIVAVSRGVADDLSRTTRIPRSKICVIYNPVVEDSLQERSRAPAGHPWLEDDIPVILAAARLAPQKDFPMLLESFKRVCEERPARLMILGDGDLREQLEELARELGIAEHVAFLGFVGNPLSYMSRCTIFALSSRYEGLPTGLIEALACGAPVVSTDCPSGPSEIISNGVDGLLVPVSDSDAMADAIGRLLDDSELRHAIREKGRERASVFSVENAIDEYEELLVGLSDHHSEVEVAGI